MKKIFLNLLLLIALLPVLPMSASAEIHEGGPNYYFFQNFEDLKELTKLEGTSEYTITAVFERSELIIEEDLTIPENYYLEMDYSNVVVPADVSLTISDGSWLDCSGSLVISGNVDAYGIVRAGSLDITGKLSIWKSLTCSEIKGIQNITFKSDTATFTRIIRCYDLDGLVAALSESANASESTNYIIYFNNQRQYNVVIDTAITIPQNTLVTIYCPYDQKPQITISEAGSLTVEGCLNLYLPLTVNGTLINNNLISIDRTDSYRTIDFYQGIGFGGGYCYGEMEIAPTGSYSGDGEIGISDWIKSTPDRIVTGVDLSEFEITNTGPSYYNYWSLRKRLSPVSNPAWSKRGDISWTTALPTEGQYLVKIHREGEDTVYEEITWASNKVDAFETISLNQFTLGYPETGSYFFTVTSLSDGSKYANSETVTSPIWTYTKPSAVVASCTGLTWDGTEISYAIPSDMTNVGGYRVNFYYSPEATSARSLDIPPKIASYVSQNPEQVFHAKLEESLFQSYGIGYYYFNVDVLSSDITVACNNTGSELSAGYFYDPNHIHNYGNWETTTATSCNIDGIQSRSCKCGETETKSIPATGHTWDEGKVTTEPTATEAGVKTFTCTACQDTREEEIPATGAVILWGDVSGDGFVDSYDAALILKYDVMLIGDGDLNLAAADVSGDGIVDSYDASLILKFDVMLIDKFPAQG